MAEAATVRTYAELTPAERCRAPYLHVDPCYLNIAQVMRVFGGHFREYYNQTCIKEETEYARIFNHHLLVTYALDACRSREVTTLGEVLTDARRPLIFCSTQQLAGTEQALIPGNRRSRNRVMLPYPYERPVSLQFANYNFLSDIEREDQARPARLAVLAQLEIVNEREVVAETLFMGTPTFDHFRNDEETLGYSGLAGEWFELLEGDIAGLRKASPPPGEWPGLSFAEADLANGDTVGAAILTDIERSHEAIARLAGAPAQLLILRAPGKVSPQARQALRETAVAPHAPRHYAVLEDNGKL